MIYLSVKLNETTPTSSLYRSGDGGKNYTASKSHEGQYSNVRVSDTGETIMAFDNWLGYLEVGNGSTNTWLQHNLFSDKTRNLGEISGDGQTLIAGGSNSFVVSSNGGKNWVKRSIAGKIITSGGVSQDGSLIVVSTSAKDIYTSSDKGATWNLKESLGSDATIKRVAVSDTGRVVVIRTSDPTIYVSDDQATSWGKIASPNAGRWNTMNLSGDGKTIVSTMGGTSALGTMYITKIDG
jgi:hypothetical protein